jgi:hypothetical protein
MPNPTADAADPWAARISVSTSAAAATAQASLHREMISPIDLPSGGPRRRGRTAVGGSLAAAVASDSSFNMPSSESEGNGGGCQSAAGTSIWEPHPEHLRRFPAIVAGAV